MTEPKRRCNIEHNTAHHTKKTRPEDGTKWLSSAQEGVSEKERARKARLRAAGVGLFRKVMCDFCKRERMHPSTAWRGKSCQASTHTRPSRIGWIPKGRVPSGSPLRHDSAKRSLNVPNERSRCLIAACSPPSSATPTRPAYKSILRSHTASLPATIRYFIPSTFPPTPQANFDRVGFHPATYLSARSDLVALSAKRNGQPALLDAVKHR